MFTFKRCDNCGMINPPCLYGNPRLCANCATSDGFYKKAENDLGANGKIGNWKLRLPFQIKWRGWWTLA